MKIVHRNFETNKSNYIMLGFELIRKDEPTLNSDSVKEMFPDWAEIEPGFWSEFSRRLTYGAGHFLEIGLYREPMDSGEYSGRYTLQIFDGDEVIFCADVDETR